MISKFKVFSGVFLMPLVMLSFFSCDTENIKVTYNFDNIGDRVWVGEDFWTVPIEDWQLKDGRIECGSQVQNAAVSLLPYVLGEKKEDFSFSVDMGLLNEGSVKIASGISIGVEAIEEADIRSAIYFGSGINAGVNLEGFAFLGQQTQKLPENFDFKMLSLNLNGSYKTGSLILALSVLDNDDNSIAEIIYEPETDIRGIIQLKNNILVRPAKSGIPGFWFDNISFEGPKFQKNTDNSFGPIFWTMYTTNAKVLKLTAQMPPLGPTDNKEVLLQLKKDNMWAKVSSATVSTDSRIATFKLDNWDMSRETEYRVSHEYINSQGKKVIAEYDGIIQKEPVDRPLRVGALTCQYHYGFPYSPLVKNLNLSNPDLLYFSGDQIYEQNGGYPIKKEPEDTAILNYLGKWYMFGWAFGDLMRNVPQFVLRMIMISSREIFGERQE